MIRNRFSWVVFVSVILLLTQCNHTSNNEHLDNLSAANIETIQKSDSLQFQQVKTYLHSIGKHERLSASAIAGDTSLMIDYYSVEIADWTATSDHTNRIYFSTNAIQYGNILWEDSLSTELHNYSIESGVDTPSNAQQTIEKLYQQLIEQSVK